MSVSSTLGNPVTIGHSLSTIRVRRAAVASLSVFDRLRNAVVLGSRSVGTHPVISVPDARWRIILTSVRLSERIRGSVANTNLHRPGGKAARCRLPPGRSSRASRLVS